ncbi:MAG: hypothetical protein PGN13_01220 [Patulibacter minatonensis]
MFWRRPKLSPQEHAQALEFVLRDLDPDARRRAEALMGRMTEKDRAQTERLLIKVGATSWPRIEKIMLRFGDLAPEGDRASVDAPSPSRPSAGPSTTELRDAANRALGRRPD